MTDEKLIDLMNDEIDGFNTPSQSSRLKREIAVDPESWVLFENLKSLSGILERVEEVDPPESLKHTIMNCIPRNRYAASKSRGRFELLCSRAKSIFAPRYVLSFATGTLAGLLLFGLYTGTLDRGEIDPSTLSGSMGGQNWTVAISTTDRAEFSFETVSGFVEISTSRSRVRARVSLSGEGETVVALSFSANDLRFAEVSKAGDSPSSLELGSEKILLVLSGEGEHTVAFDRLTAKNVPISVRIKSGGELFEQKLSTESK